VKPPSIDDRFVRVTAYMTDEEFGYEYWAARQFASRDVVTRRPAVLIVCADRAEQEAALTYLRERAQEKGERS
jgi:hypothetical protein